MNDSAHPPKDPRPDAPRMVILAINQTYWLSEGSEFLTPMLHGNGYFPVPITCIKFRDSFELRAYIGPGINITEFWGINPDVVDRLRRDNHLTEIFADKL